MSQYWEWGKAGIISMAEAIRCMVFLQEYNQLLIVDVTAYYGYEDFTIDLMATAINMMPALPISYWYNLQNIRTYVHINTYTHTHTNTHIGTP